MTLPLGQCVWTMVLEKLVGKPTLVLGRLFERNLNTIERKKIDAKKQLFSRVNFDSNSDFGDCYSGWQRKSHGGFDRYQQDS